MQCPELPHSHSLTIRCAQGRNFSSPSLFVAGEQKSDRDEKDFFIYFFFQGEESICVGRTLSSKLDSFWNFFLTHFIPK